MAIFIPNDTTQKLTPLRTPQYTTSVTPEMIAGPEVRNLEALGKTAGEITDWVITDRNNKDLAIINDIENKGKEIEMRRKLAASKMMGKNALGLLAREEAFLGSNYKQPDGEPPLVEVQEYQKMYGELDDRLKTVADNLRGRRKISHLSRIGAHEQAQSIAHTVQSANDSITLSIASSAVNHLDEEQRMLDIAMIDSQIDAIANAQGWDYAQRELKRKTAVSSIHVDVVKGYINAKDVAGAEKYFSNFKDEIVGDTSAMQQSIATRRVNVLGEDEGDKAFGMWKTAPQKAYDYVDKIKDPALQAEARSQLQHSVDDFNKARTETLRTANVSLSKQMMEKDENGEYLVKKFSDFDQEKIEEIMGQPDGMARLKNMKAWFAVRDNPIEPPQSTQIKAYQILTRMSRSPNKEDRKKFMGLDIASMSSMGKEYKQHFIDRQEKDAEDPGSLISRDQILTAREKLTKLNLTENATVQGALEISLIRTVHAWEKENGAKMNPAKYQETVDSLYSLDKVRGLIAAHGEPVIPSKPRAESRTAEGQVSDRLKALDRNNQFNTKEEEGIFREAAFSGFDGISKANLAAGRAPETTYLQRKRYMNFLLKNKVEVDVLGPDFLFGGEKMAYTLTEKELEEKGFVTTEDGVEVRISDIKKMGEEESKKVSQYMADNGMEGTWLDKATAQWKVGDQDKAIKKKSNFRSGTIKHVDGREASRSSVLDTLDRTPLEMLTSDNFRKDIFKLYKNEGVKLLNWVIRKKEREANSE